MNAVDESTPRGLSDAKLGMFLFSAALLVRAAFLLWLDEPIIFGKYTFFAQKLWEGGDLGRRLVDLSPFYLYWMTAWVSVLGPMWVAAKWFQAMVGAGICVLIFLFGRRVVGREAAFLGALIYGFYGNVIILESTLEPEVFLLLFNLSAVLFLQMAADAPAARPGRTGWIALGGLFTGLSIVTKPSFLLFVPLGAVWVLTTAPVKTPVFRRFIQAVGFCAAAGVVVLPVTVRNYVALNDVVLVTADAGKVFYHGNAAGATALEWTGLPDEGFAEEAGAEPDYAHVLFRQTASRLSGRDLSPSESSKFWMRRAMEDIRSDPRTALVREAEKLLLFFSDYEIHYIATAFKEYKSTLHYPFVRYGIIASLGLTGMLLSLRAFRGRFLVFAPVLVYLASGLMFIVQSRYRTPAIPYLCLFAGHTVFWFKQKLTLKEFAPLIPAAVVAALCFALSYQGLKTEIRATDHWQTATKIHYQLGAKPLFSAGRHAQAVAELNICIAMVPGFSPAYNLRGRALAILGDTSAALADFETVMALSPGMADGYKNAGFIHLLAGNREKAKPLLQKALDLAPQDARVQKALDGLD